MPRLGFGGDEALARMPLKPQNLLVRTSGSFARNLVLLLALGAGLPQIAAAQTVSYTFTHFAGTTGGGDYRDGAGTLARFNSPIGTAVDSAGNVYVAEFHYNIIRKITPSGFVTTLAGFPGVAGSADGVRANARFNFPQGLAADAAGNIYVADSSNRVIRKVVSRTGEVTTLAGLAGSLGASDGTGSSARFDFPVAVATDSAGNVYVADCSGGQADADGGQTIRKITPAGVVTTLAGTPGQIGSADGVGSAARFNFIFGLAALTVDPAGNVYVADSNNSTIRKITPDGRVTTLAGSPGQDGSADGVGNAARFSFPAGIATDGSDLYVADSGNGTIRKVTPSGIVTTLAGIAGDFEILAADGTTLYLPDINGNAIRKLVIATGQVTTLAGGSPAESGSADGIGTAARFNSPFGMTTDGTDLYVTDRKNGTVRRVALASGQVTTLAASGTALRGITTDRTNLFLVGSNAIQAISIATGQVATIAGASTVQGSADGTGTAARFRAPRDIATDGQNLYVTDTGNFTIRKMVIATGEVTTFAGTAGASGTADGTGNAARFRSPGVITTDGAKLFVFDSDSVRQIVIATAQVTTLVPAGVFSNGATTDGNSLYIAASNSVRQISIASGQVTTVAGGLFGAADGTDSVAQFIGAAGIVLIGNTFFVADGSNNAIRVGRPAIADAPVIDSPTGIAQTPRQLSTSGSQATSWNWILVTFPEGSTATISNPAIANPTFTPDVEGFYRFKLDASGPAGRRISIVDLNVLCALDAPASPAIKPAGNPSGPVTGTDFLTVSWSAASGGTPPSGYEYRINGDPYSAVSGTSATAPPRGKNDPITLFVRASGCTPSSSGPEVTSQTYSPAPPGANFTFSGGQANQPINFTDTSSPQATTWLWLFDDGGTSTSQSPSHTFTQGGTHNVALIASNGSGSTLKILPVPVTGAASSRASTSARIGFESSEPERRRLNDVAISGPRQAWLTITSRDSQETIVYLRFLDQAGRLLLERRLSIPAEQEGINDIGAYGLEGTFTLELVSGQRFNASLAPADSAPCRNRKGDCVEQP